MHSRRKALYVSLFFILLSALYTAITSTAEAQAENTKKATLSNVRDYAVAWQRANVVAPYSYAIDSGYLYMGTAGQWYEITLPPNVIAGAVATDPYHQQTIYVGAANEMALYVTRDQGDQWQRVRLDQKYLGGVTDIAVNGAQRTILVGTDNTGIYRLRDVGSSIVHSGHTPLSEPVLQIVSDHFGAGLLFARTEWTVYRGMNNGQQWLPLDGFDTTPTSMAIAHRHPAVVYIGTNDRGLLRSTNGFTWQLLDESRQTEAGLRVQVNALAIDTAQPELIYAARSFLSGHSTIQPNATGVEMSQDGGLTWQSIETPQNEMGLFTELLPVNGEAGALFALSTTSRAPMPLGRATMLMEEKVPVSVITKESAQPILAIQFSSWLVTLLVSILLAWLLWQEVQRRPTLVPVSVRSR